MNKKNIQAGDIWFIDSEKQGAKVVKIFMTAPTIWHHLWRKIRDTQEKVKYYHPGILYSTRRTLDQQWEVEFDDASDILQSERPLIVFRRKNEYSGTTQHFIDNAKKDLGQKWGIIHTLFGRFPTWLTGIKFFTRYIKLPNEEVSAGRVARWMYETYGETFGYKKYTEATTHTMVKYMLANSDLYEVIYKRS